MASVAETTGEAQLYERHSAVVFRYCLRMLGTREDAEDAAQTTFFQAVRAMRRGVVPAFEQAWLMAIAKNECKSRHRASSRRKAREFVSDPHTLEELAEAPNGGDGRLIGVRHALGRLPEMQRRALLLREWQGCSYAEIAEDLGVSGPAVEALIFRARKSLARELGEETKSRRHALDLASLLGALKSALGGGAAVKFAAGLAAVATVGVVAGGAEQAPPAQAPAPRITVRQLSSDQAAKTQPNAVVSNRSQTTRASQPLSSSRPSRSAPAEPPSTAPVPRAGQPAQTPVLAPVAPPTPAAAPSVPSVPKVEAPAPPVPSLPAVQLPQVPQLPPVQLPHVPQLPDVPGVPDLQGVPDLPTLP